MTSYTARPEEGEIMHCLHEWRSGSLEAENELFRLAFPNLCCLASYILKGERCTHGLEPIDLVNQVRSWIKRDHAGTLFRNTECGIRNTKVVAIRGQAAKSPPSPC